MNQQTSKAQSQSHCHIQTSMGYIQDARENHVKKKVEEGITYFLLRPQILNPKRTDYKKC